MNVLIVDDDKLVRKGLMVLMPWQQFGLKVAGEAANGEAALQFLQVNEVDLLITDLAMPVMSGIELMRTVRIRYPNIWLVVLTFHQDFEYIQEALRLGAIDYIVKTQLEKEKMEDVLSRIMGRITEENGKHPRASRILPGTVENEQFQCGCGLAFLSLHPEQDSLWMERLPAKFVESLMEVEQDIWLWAPDGDDSGWQQGEELRERLKADPAIVILRLPDISGYKKTEVIKWLREFRCRGLMYELEEGKRLYDISIVTEQQSWPIVFEDDVLDMHKWWSSLRWVNHDDMFNQRLSELKQMRLPKEKLESIFYSAIREWERTLSTGEMTESSRMGSLTYWYEWVEWIHQTRRHLIECTNKSLYSKPIVDSILKAVDLIAQDISQQTGLVEMAGMVNMSRSYFSSCFKDIVGKPFNEYVRDQRIAKAEELLSQTSIPIIRIAEKIGYPNEKYFSRLFREQIGLTPSEYRQQRQASIQTSDR
ncbi:response regulator transcription factor [Paenibacillus mendelii]|uniref:Response regulator n=1 Tax=Paenibacillus mendelii TaxID=206163 RepID=A0ABV6JBV8_9BACL|nr:response regulator [Paenibacillus mendelii]MCQ6562648.1 response regulator [Paenibacillus mendelii]